MIMARGQKGQALLWNKMFFLLLLLLYFHKMLEDSCWNWEEDIELDDAYTVYIR